MQSKLILYVVTVFLATTFAFTSSVRLITHKTNSGFSSTMTMTASGFSLGYLRSRFSKASKSTIASIQITHNYNDISDITRKQHAKINRSMQEINCHLPPRWHYKCIDGKKFEVVYQ